MVSLAEGGSGPADGGDRSSRGGGGSAKTGQHREYLLHGGRYASCVHAGGLSCSHIVIPSFSVVLLTGVNTTVIQTFSFFSAEPYIWLFFNRLQRFLIIKVNHRIQAKIRTFLLNRRQTMLGT